VKALNRIHVLRSALAGVLLAGAVGSCGKAADGGGQEDLQIDSNTNWLMRCDADDQCSGSLRCYCGQCSQPCSESNECRLLAGAECASSGGAVCTDQPSAGGLCVLGCTSDGECGPDFTCTNSQCVPTPCTGGYQSWDSVYATVANDLARLDADDATFTRYASIANRWVDGACGPTLTAERQGLSKFVNSLSLDATVTPPLQIDAAGTLYRINLRDYGWDRPVEISGHAYADVWEALIASNPFAVPFVGDDADDAVADSGTSIPVMFSNSLIATGTRPEVYYAILDIPPSYDELLADLGVDPAEPGVRAGYGDRPEVIATHRELGFRSGYLWELRVIDGPSGALFNDPLQNPTGERQLLFTLANGLQAFAYAESAGLRTDDSDLLLDTNEDNFRAVVPRTPLRQHPQGPSLTDQVRAYMADNPDRFSAEALAAISAVYPGAEAISELIRSDYETFTRPALEAAGIDLRLPEPIMKTYDAYNGDMTLEDVAGDFLLTAGDVSDNLSLLDPAFTVLDGGVMDRDDFALLYRQGLCTLSVVLENLPSPEWCR
jgi:hypothetical protein